MRKKGIKFPEQYDESKVPVLTPAPDAASEGARSASSNQARGSSSIDTSSYSNASSSLGGLSTPELYRVATNVSEMFEDMLYEAQKDSSSIGNHGVMEELAVEVREILHRMEGAIPIAVAEGDEDLEKYLSINDDLHAALKKYDELLSGNQAAEEAAMKTTKKDASDDIDLVDPFGLEKDLSPRSNQVSDVDDPFADFVRARTGTKSDGADSKLPPASKSPQAVPQQEEEDPFASFVQQRASKILSSSNQSEVKSVTSSAPAAPAKDLIDLWDATSVASLPVVPSATNNFTASNTSDPFDMLDFSTKVGAILV
ncbi:unnamed protein product [Phytophthora fragariaefolia]|uniref:Unnamed protein product n=1 Tax=Phytophthora fragariaefolia TaxID=1490495 RepID=A0A9W7D498_9STRA|nr:unnamed protein product [Phytophthora fragariaefolia]